MWSTFSLYLNPLSILFITTLENYLAVSTEAEHTFLITQKFYVYAFIYPTAIMYLCSPKDMPKNVHRQQPIHNSPKLEIAQMLINRRMDK